MRYNSLLLLILLYQLSWIWSLGALSRWLLCLLKHSHLFLNTSLPSGTAKYFRLILYCSWPRPAASSFLKDHFGQVTPWFIPLNNSSENKILSVVSRPLFTSQVSLPAALSHHSLVHGVLTAPRTCPAISTSGPLHRWILVPLQLQHPSPPQKGFLDLST